MQENGLNQRVTGVNETEISFERFSSEVVPWSISSGSIFSQITWILNSPVSRIYIEPINESALKYGKETSVEL